MLNLKSNTVFSVIIGLEQPQLLHVSLLFTFPVVLTSFLICWLGCIRFGGMGSHLLLIILTVTNVIND